MRPRRGARVVLGVLLLASAIAPQAAGGKPPVEETLVGVGGDDGGRHAADLHSSRGLAEANPLLRNGQGGINPVKGAVVKSAAAGGLLLLEALLLKKAPEHRLEKPFTIINTAAAGAVAATAVRNYRIPRSAPGGLPR